MAMFTGSIPPIVRGSPYPIAIELRDDAALLAESVLSLAQFRFVLRAASRECEFASQIGAIAAPGVIQCMFSADQTAALPLDPIRLTIEWMDDPDGGRLVDVSAIVEA